MSSEVQHTASSSKSHLPDQFEDESAHHEPTTDQTQSKTDLWSSDQNESYPSDIEEDLSPIPYNATHTPTTELEDLLLPPESLQDEQYDGLLEVELPNVNASTEQALDHKLHEESKAVLNSMLNSNPIESIPAEDGISKSPSARAPELGLDAIGEANSLPASHMPAPTKEPLKDDRDEQSAFIISQHTPQTLPTQEISIAPTPSVDHTSSHPPLTADTLIEDSTKDRFQIEGHLRPLSEKRIERLEAFISTLENARDSKVLIVIKGHPDPDSIGSAVAQQYCFKHFGIQSSIIYFDEISHPENRALVKVIEMELILHKPDFDFSIFDYLAFVDSQSADLPVNLEFDPPPILTFVDHHKDTGKVKAEFIDIREDYGSTSSIYAQYLEYIPELSLQKSLATHAHIATALMHGIRTDTDNLMLAMSSDFRAAAYLRQFIDRDLLRMVSKQSVTARTMEIIKQGLNNKVIRGTFLLAGVGFVREEDRDGIAQTADFLLRHEGVETAVVFGIVNNNIVDGSLRTSSATVDPDRWLKELFGEDSTGKPYGGGRRNKGGFRIPLGLLAFSPDRKALWKLGEQTIHDLIFDKIGEKEEKKEER